MKHYKNDDNTLFLFMAIILLVCLFFGLRSTLKVDTPQEIIEVGTTENISAEVTFLGMDFSRLIKTSGEVNTNVLGNYTVKYNTFFGANLFEKSYKVVDTLAPEISLVGEKDLIIQKREDFVDPGAIALDNYDGNISSEIISKIVGENIHGFNVFYSIVDSSGNVSSIQRTVTINAGNVYLTFDDGPSSDITPKILDILKEKNVPATFFVVGFEEYKVPIIKRIIEEGHTIGLHGYSHDYSKIYTSINNLMENFYKIEELVKTSTEGYTSKFIRFPGGASNTISKKYCIGIMNEATSLVEEEGFTYFDWNVDSQDAGGAKSAEEVYNNVIQGITPGNNIVLMHDSAGHTYTLEALEAIINFCINNNYELKAIDSETKPIHHPTFN